MTTEPSLVQDECQWQEDNQADPSLVQQPLDVGDKCEVLGDPQEAWAGHRDCVCPPGPDTPENASCSRIDTRVRGSGRVSALCQAALRKRTDGHAMDQGLSVEQVHLWPLPNVSFFLICC